MEAEVEEYLDLGLIRPSNSPWASPVLMIRKPDGGIRFCIDYRRLNAVTVKDCYPMPLIDDILDVLGDARLFSTMDIASGYWNVPMHENSVAETAFTCKYGLYEWLVMPFGFSNAVPAFERKDFPSHLIRVRQDLTRFRQAGFKLKMKKCHWGRSQVAFLGHIVTPTGILPNPEKVKAVMNVQRPCDVRGIRSFLGLTSYFHRYIPGYALISAPLERLKAKEAPYFWNEDCESAFQQLKRALMKPPILVYPDMTKRFKLYVDSSRYDVGACLMQESEGHDRVVAYASKLLTGSQKNWVTKQDGVSEIECWGVVWATRKFRCYLDKREFDVFTDHQALTWVFSAGNRTGNAKLAREPSETVPELEIVGPDSGGGGDSDSEPELEDDDELELEYATEPTEVETGEASATPVTPSSVDVFGLDSKLFLAEQQEVTWIRALVELLQDEAVPLNPFLRRRLVLMAPKHCVVNGLLMRTVHLPANVGPAGTVTVPVVPLPYVNTVLHFCHRDLLSSHLGLTKTLEKVRRHAYWPGWRKDVAEYLRDCMKCGGGKGPRPWTSGRMQRMPVADLTGPFSLLVVDAVGPLPETERGNKYILVFVDYFTRWAEAFAVGALDSITFVDAMVNGVVSRHGVPSRLLSDNGRNFTSDVAKSFYQTLGIKKLFGAAYHPQTQGLVERFNGTLIGMLRMHVDEAQTDWDVYLPRVLFAYRTAYHEALGDTPFFTLYGRDPVLPLDVGFLNLGKKWKSNEVAQYRRELYRSLKDSRHLVERQLVKAQDRHEQRLRNQVEVQFEVGDPVWVYQFFRAKRGEKRTKKLAFSWHGPYRVVSKVGENAYRIEIPSHPDKVVTINVNRLKKFRWRWTRPYMDKIPNGITENGDEVEDGPLDETDLPASSFTELLTVGRDDVAISGTDAPLLDVVVKRVVNRAVEYLALTANYETFWLTRSALMPAYSELVRFRTIGTERTSCIEKECPVG
ncbi:hypothetical protein PR003_g14547 [Phytophthora rubi]|nr:hypothetical protein PR003_g14547 [Phytophthora rubi]